VEFGALFIIGKNYSLEILFHSQNNYTIQDIENQEKNGNKK